MRGASAFARSVVERPFEGQGSRLPERRYIRDTATAFYYLYRTYVCNCRRPRVRARANKSGSQSLFAPFEASDDSFVLNQRFAMSLADRRERGVIGRKSARIGKESARIGTFRGKFISGLLFSCFETSTHFGIMHDKTDSSEIPLSPATFHRTTDCHFVSVRVIASRTESLTCRVYGYGHSHAE